MPINHRSPKTTMSNISRLIIELKEALQASPQQEQVQSIVGALKHAVEALISFEQAKSEQLKQLDQSKEAIKRIHQGIADKLKQCALPCANQTNLSPYQLWLNNLRFITKVISEGGIKNDSPILSSFDAIDPLEIIAVYGACLTGFLSLSNEELANVNAKICTDLEKAYPLNQMKYHLIMGMFGKAGNEEAMKAEFAYLLEDDSMQVWTSKLDELTKKREDLLKRKSSQDSQQSDEDAALQEALAALNIEFDEVSKQLGKHEAKGMSRGLVYLTRISTMLAIVPPEKIADSIHAYLQEVDLWQPLYTINTDTPFESLNVILSWLKNPVQSMIAKAARSFNYTELKIVLDNIIDEVGSLTNQEEVREIQIKSEIKMADLLIKAIFESLAPELGLIIAQLMRHATPEQKNQFAALCLQLEKVFATFVYGLDRKNGVAHSRQGRTVTELLNEVQNAFSVRKLFTDLQQFESLVRSSPYDASAVKETGEALIPCFEKVLENGHDNKGPYEDVDDVSDSIALAFQVRDAAAAKTVLEVFQPVMQACVNQLAEHLDPATIEAEAKREGSAEKSEPVQALSVFQGGAGNKRDHESQIIGNSC